MQFLTEQQAADYVGVSLSTMRRWRKRPSGPRCFKYAGIIRYAKSVLDAFIERNTEKPKDK